MFARSLVVLAVLALVAAAPAEARFGKRSNSKGSKNSTSSGSSGSASPGGEHSASAVGAGGGSATATAQPVYVPADRPYRHRHRGWYGGWYGGGYVPVYLVPPAHQVHQTSEEPAHRAVRVSVGAEGMAFAKGASFGLGASFEGARWGFSSAFHNLAVATDDGTAGFDTIRQLNLHLTYAVLAGERGRLRLEGGADSAFTADLFVMGPSFGASGVLWVGGPLAIEGAVSVTPFPYRQVDYRAGIGVGLGPVGLRGGWRSLFLDDAGLVDGVVHQDLFGGPYVGLAFVF